MCRLISEVIQRVYIGGPAESASHEDGPQPSRPAPLVGEEAQCFGQAFFVALGGTKKPEAALRQFPELARAYADVRAIEAKTNAESLTAQQRETVMARVRENVAASIERGDAAKVVRAEPERVSHRSQERDLER